jgi:hypothetical protein
MMLFAKTKPELMRTMRIAEKIMPFVSPSHENGIVNGSFAFGEFRCDTP